MTPFCRVCGYSDGTPPWGEDDKSPEFNFCPCCGVEHGYQDSTLAGVRRFRVIWEQRGWRWDDDRLKPTEWDPFEQMRNIPNEFL